MRNAGKRIVAQRSGSSGNIASFLLKMKKTATSDSLSKHIMEAPLGIGPRNKGFADLRLTSWLWRRINGAVDEARTRDLHLGKVALYQLSYYRILYGALGRNRTTDTVIFSHMLYQLSYQGIHGDPKGARTPDLQRDRLAF